MAGGIIQLVAYGIEDLYLTANPQVTFFKIVYRRHTNFSIESIKQQFSLEPNFGIKSSCIVSRLGDLAGRTYIHLRLPPVPKFIDPETGCEDPFKKFAWVENIGYALVKEVTLEIGGKMVDRRYGEFFYIWSQLAERQPIGLDKMIGNVPEIYEFSNGKPSFDIYVPLDFWFTKNSGLNMPLASLSSSDVKIGVTFRDLSECYRIGPTNSIEIVEDIVLFKEGDYIEQEINGQKIYGYYMGFDFVEKKLMYLKIRNSELTHFEAPVHNGRSRVSSVMYRIKSSIVPSIYCTPCSEEEYESTQIGPLNILEGTFYIDYVYLDVEERAKFHRFHQEYLVTQLQSNFSIGIQNTHYKQQLSLINPCSEHLFVAQLDHLVGPRTINDLFNYTDSPVRLPRIPVPTYPGSYIPISPFNNRLFLGAGLIRDAVMYLGGEKLFPDRNSIYFNNLVPYEHHYRGPVIGINALSFSLFPEDLVQPSGTCNMTAIDDISMNMSLGKAVTEFNQCSIRSYTINLNVFRVLFGLGGIAFT